MIETLRQYTVTMIQLDKFEKALAAAESTGQPSDFHPLIFKAVVDGLKSIIEELKAELDVWDDKQK